MRKNKRHADKNHVEASDLQVDILLMLCQGARYSANLVAAVEETRRREVPLATFYRQLQKALERGWIRAADEASEGHVGAPGKSKPGRGRPERLYSITDEGSRILQSGLELYGRRVELARQLGLLVGRTR